MMVLIHMNIHVFENMEPLAIWPKTANPQPF